MFKDSNMISFVEQDKKNKESFKDGSGWKDKDMMGWDGKKI